MPSSYSPEPKTLNSLGTRAFVPLVFWDCWIASTIDIIGHLECEKRWRTHQNRVCCPPAPLELKTLNILGTRVRTPLVFGNRWLSSRIDINRHLDHEKHLKTHQDTLGQPGVFTETPGFAYLCRPYFVVVAFNSLVIVILHYYNTDYLL